MSKVVERRRCPECAAKGGDTKGDNLVVYEDNSVHCFGCGYHPDTSVALNLSLQDGARRFVNSHMEEGWTPLRGRIEPILSRRLNEDVCRHYEYEVYDSKIGQVQIANYRNRNGKLIGQKLRAPDKRFACRGRMQDASLWGIHLWKGGGKRLTICEGEIDCLTVAQLWEGKWWPVVSLPNGASGAVQTIKKDYEFVSSFDQVVLCFDMDEAGQKAALDCAKLLRPGQASIVHLPLKDANDMVVAGESRALLTAIYEAKTYRPDGIVHAKEVTLAGTGAGRIYPYPWTLLNQKVYGMASGSITMVTSGTGMGKSTWARMIVHDQLLAGRKVGVAMLEESPFETIHDIMGIHAGLPIRQVMSMRKLNEEMERQGRPRIEFVDNLSDDVYNAAMTAIQDTGLYLYDHRGENIAEELMPKLEYMAIGLGCQIIVIDHVTQIAAIGSNGEGERRWIDQFMTSLRSFVEHSGVHLIVVSQLRKSEGKPYEEGGRITLQDLRGSGMLGTVPNTVIAMERNQQHENAAMRNIATVRVLKDRLSGFTGEAMTLKYNSITSRLEEVDVDPALVFPDKED